MSTEPAPAVRRQGRYWIGTIPYQSWEPSLPTCFLYLKGQRERGEGGYEHYQVFAIASRKISVRTIKDAGFLDSHWELTRSVKAESYCWKEDTRIGDQFEFGCRPINRASSADWDKIRSDAISGNLGLIPADVYVRYYRTLTSIAADNVQPIALLRTAVVYWGATGLGKSRRAWAEGGDLAYSKDPRTKFWCGYRGEAIVIVDEFRGAIDISHILRWTDRYPVRVEVKGSSKPLCANRFIFTSNLHPKDWYPGLDSETLAALTRRLEIINLINPFP